MLAASLSETSVFFFGSFVTMPAVQAFALYSGVAMLVLLLLQLTTFLSFLTLDAKRGDVKFTVKTNLFISYLSVSIFSPPFFFYKKNSKIELTVFLAFNSKSINPYHKLLLHGVTLM